MSVEFQRCYAAVLLRRCKVARGVAICQLGSLALFSYSAQPLTIPDGSFLGSFCKATAHSDGKVAFMVQPSGWVRRDRVSAAKFRRRLPMNPGQIDNKVKYSSL